MKIRQSRFFLVMSDFWKRYWFLVSALAWILGALMIIAPTMEVLVGMSLLLGFSLVAGGIAFILFPFPLDGQSREYIDMMRLKPKEFLAMHPEYSDLARVGPRLCMAGGILITASLVTFCCWFGHNQKIKQAEQVAYMQAYSCGENCLCEDINPLYVADYENDPIAGFWR